jgi:hypothetical protein
VSGRSPSLPASPFSKSSSKGGTAQQERQSVFILKPLFHLLHLIPRLAPDFDRKWIVPKAVGPANLNAGNFDVLLCLTCEDVETELSIQERSTVHLVTDAMNRYRDAFLPLHLGDEYIARSSPAKPTRAVKPLQPDQPVTLSTTQSYLEILSRRTRPFRFVLQDDFGDLRL